MYNYGFYLIKFSIVRTVIIESTKIKWGSSNSILPSALYITLELLFDFKTVVRYMY
jgi:hypothetical protein